MYGATTARAGYLVTDLILSFASTVCGKYSCKLGMKPGIYLD